MKNILTIPYKTLILIFFIIIKFGLQSTLIDPVYDLQRDEYLHLDQANHLAWGYLSVPPVTSWISWIIKQLGNTVFWIKFFPTCFGALTLLVVWKTIDTLKGNLFALILGATCVLLSVILRINTLYQPNSLDILCWTTFYFTGIKYFQTSKSKWLYYGALVLAIGFLNKYNILFLLLGLFPAILISKQRKIFSNLSLYGAAALLIFLVLPNLIWQYQNNFPVVHHMRELSERQLVHVDKKSFLTSQLMFFLGSLIIILLGLYALLVYPKFKNYRFLFWSFLLTLGLFLFLKAKDYYAIGVYPIYIAFGSVYLADMLEKSNKKYLQPIFLCIPVLVFIPIYDRLFPNKIPQYFFENEIKYKPYGLLRWEDGKDHVLPQDYADMLGWRELAEKVDRIYANILNPETTLVLCDNYGQAGAINYYSKLGIQAVSFNADYINWFKLQQPYRHLIRVKNRSEKEKEFAETSPYFLESSVSDSVTNQYSREFGTTIFTFISAKININEQIQKEIIESKW